MKSPSDQDDESHEVGIDVPAELHQAFTQQASHSLATYTSTTCSTHPMKASTTLHTQVQVGVRSCILV